MSEFKEVWSETIVRINARLSEKEVIRYTNLEGRVIWVTSVILELVFPVNDIHRLTVFGIAEDSGYSLREEFSGGIDDFPEEITSLIPAMIKSHEAASESNRNGDAIS